MKKYKVTYNEKLSVAVMNPSYARQVTTHVYAESAEFAIEKTKRRLAKEFKEIVGATGAVTIMDVDKPQDKAYVRADIDCIIEAYGGSDDDYLDAHGVYVTQTGFDRRYIVASFDHFTAFEDE